MIGMNKIYLGIYRYKYKPSFKYPNTIVLTKWHENGKRCEEEWKDNKLNGKCVGWYENGNKWYEIEYKDGKLNGKYIEWYINGNKRYEIEYKDGLKNGNCIYWYTNRDKWYETEYKDGREIKQKGV